MTNPIRVWNRFFFQLQSARPLGLIRICYGLLALANLALCAVEMDHWYSETGLLQGNQARILAGKLLNSPLHFLQSPRDVRIAFGFTALAALGLTIGWRTKLMSILYYAAMISLHNRNTASSSGADVLLLVFGFNLMISPCGAAYSIDSWLANRKRGTNAEPLILAWSLRLTQIQICLVYALAGILKCNGNLWINGSALHYVFNNTEVGRLNLSSLSNYPVLINLMTYSAVLFELSLAFLLWFRAVRPAVIMMGIMLHLGILASVNIPIFGELMWTGYIAFLTPPEFAVLMRVINVPGWFRRSEATPAALTSPVAITAEAPEPSSSEWDLPSEWNLPAASPRVRLSTIRIDGPESFPPPHQVEPAPATRQPTARDFAEASMDPWDSYQILL